MLKKLFGMLLVGALLLTPFTSVFSQELIYLPTVLLSGAHDVVKQPYYPVHPADAHYIGKPISDFSEEITLRPDPKWVWGENSEVIEGAFLGDINASQSFWFPKERLVTGLIGWVLKLPVTTNNKSGTFEGWFNPDPNEVFRTLRWGTSDTQVFTDTLGITHTLESLIQAEFNVWESTTDSLGLTWLDVSNTSSSPSSTWDLEIKIANCPEDPGASCFVHDSFVELSTEDVAPWSKATIYLHPGLVGDNLDYVQFTIRHELGHTYALADLGAVTSIMSSTAWDNGHVNITNKDKQSLEYYFGNLGKYDFLGYFHQNPFPFITAQYNDWVPNGYNYESHLYHKEGGVWVWKEKITSTTSIGSYADVDQWYAPYTPKVIFAQHNVVSGDYYVRAFETIGVNDSGGAVRVLANIAPVISVN